MDHFVSKNKLAFFYGFSFLISWSSWGVMYLVYDGSTTSPIVFVFSSLGGLGPLLSLFAIQKLTRGEFTANQVLSQIKIRGAKIHWVIPAIIAIPVINLLANLILYLFRQEEQLALIKSGPDDLGLWVLPVMAIHFTASLVTSPLFEEPGWRGFALPRLQAKFGRHVGSLFVGVLWWVWHQPMNLTFGLNPTLYSALSMIALSFMIDSLFNLSGRNVFIAMLAHQSYGTVFTFLVQRNENWLELGLRIALVVVLRVIESTRKAPDDIPQINIQEVSG